MPKIKNHVRLSDDERNTLLRLISKGKAPAKKILHAHILLAADENGPNGKISEEEIAQRLHISRQTVHTIRSVYSQKGLNTALGRKKRETPPVPAKITGDVEARIIALSCSEPPEGQNKWTLRLLAGRAVKLNIVDSISHVAVGQVLKKTNSNRI
jgi:transposase